MTIMRPVAGFTELDVRSPVSTPTRRDDAPAASRIRWYSLSA